MRDPYIELGTAIVGQAIRDWRLESAKVAYMTGRSVILKRISKFFKGDMASLVLGAIEIDPKLVLAQLKKENEIKRRERERALRRQV